MIIFNLRLLVSNIPNNNGRYFEILSNLFTHLNLNKYM